MRCDDEIGRRGIGRTRMRRESMGESRGGRRGAGVVVLVSVLVSGVEWVWVWAWGMGNGKSECDPTRWNGIDERAWYDMS